MCFVSVNFCNLDFHNILQRFFFMFTKISKCIDTWDLLILPLTTTAPLLWYISHRRCIFGTTPVQFLLFLRTSEIIVLILSIISSIVSSYVPLHAASNMELADSDVLEDGMPYFGGNVGSSTHSVDLHLFIYIFSKYTLAALEYTYTSASNSSVFRCENKQQ
jgi:hypothetical protein